MSEAGPTSSHCWMWHAVHWLAPASSAYCLVSTLLRTCLPYCLSHAHAYLICPASIFVPSCKHIHVLVSCVSCRVYSDGFSKDHKQSFISWAVAVTTLTIYTGWMHVLIGLMLASFFSRTCLYVLLAVWATTFLPAKPVLWNAFCRSWVSDIELGGYDVSHTGVAEARAPTCAVHSSRRWLRMLCRATERLQQVMGG